jgi:hypothetical protein
VSGGSYTLSSGFGGTGALQRLLATLVATQPSGTSNFRAEIKISNHIRPS